MRPQVWSQTAVTWDTQKVKNTRRCWSEYGPKTDTTPLTDDAQWER